MVKRKRRIDCGGDCDRHIGRLQTQTANTNKQFQFNSLIAFTIYSESGLSICDHTTLIVNITLETSFLEKYKIFQYFNYWIFLLRKFQYYRCFSILPSEINGKLSHGCFCWCCLREHHYSGWELPIVKTSIRSNDDPVSSYLSRNLGLVYVTLCILLYPYSVSRNPQPVSSVPRSETGFCFKWDFKIEDTG